MKAITIKCINPGSGQDTLMLRAFRDSGDGVEKKTKFIVSTTNHSELSINACARRCAVKAFQYFEEPTSEPDEIETRIRILTTVPNIWVAQLEPKAGKMSTDKPVPKVDANEGRACGCLEKIRAQLAAHHKSEIDFELSAWLNMKTMKSYAGLPPLKYTWQDGKKKKKSHVVFPRCPFCGVPNAN